MASDISTRLRRIVMDRTKEVEAETKKRARIAMNKTEDRVAQKIQEIIDRDTVDFFYNGYTPKNYIRTGQLRDAEPVAPLIKDVNTKQTIGFAYGADFDEKLMDHTSYNVNAYWTRKDGTQGEGEYMVTKDKGAVDEERILNLFSQGIHAMTPVNQGWIWWENKNGDMAGHAVDVLDEWVDSGGIEKIFDEEMDKLLKKTMRGDD